MIWSCGARYSDSASRTQPASATRSRRARRPGPRANSPPTLLESTSESDDEQPAATTLEPSAPGPAPSSGRRVIQTAADALLGMHQPNGTASVSDSPATDSNDDSDEDMEPVVAEADSDALLLDESEASEEEHEVLPEQDADAAAGPSSGSRPARSVFRALQKTRSGCSHFSEPHKKSSSQ